jgi:hypothetical protein
MPPHNSICPDQTDLTHDISHAVYIYDDWKSTKSMYLMPCSAVHVLWRFEEFTASIFTIEETLTGHMLAVCSVVTARV